jgi:hypothetical protein
MFPTRQAPPARPADAWIDDQDRAGPDGEDDFGPTEGQQRRWYDLRPKPRRPTDLWGFNSTLVDGAGMASADRLRGFSVAVVVT